MDLLSEGNHLRSEGNELLPDLNSLLSKTNSLGFDRKFWQLEANEWVFDA